MKCSMKNLSPELKKLVKSLPAQGFIIIQSFVISGVQYLEIRDSSKATAKSIWLVNNPADNYDVRATIYSPLVYKDNKHDGLTHLAEHCLFHKVQLRDGRVVSIDELMSYGNNHNVLINAHTTIQGISVVVKFTPTNLMDIALSDRKYNLYPYVKDIHKPDNTELAFDILESITYRGDVDPEQVEKEKNIVSAEIKSILENPNHVLWTYIMNEISDMYNNIGTPDDILSYTYEDINEAISLFRRNVTCGILSMNLDIIPYDKAIGYINQMNKVLNNGASKSDRCKKIKYSNVADHLIKARTINPELYGKIELLDSDQDNVAIVVTWDNNVLSDIDNNTKYGILEIFATIMVNGLNRYFTREFRETYGRCYNIKHIISRIADKNIEVSNPCIGLWFNLKDGEFDTIQNKKYVNETGLSAIEEEIGNIFTNISCTEEEFYKGVETFLELKRRGIGDPYYEDHTIGGITLGFVNIVLEDMIDKIDPRSITYEVFCKYLEYIKDHWTAKVYAKNNIK